MGTVLGQICIAASIVYFLFFQNKQNFVIELVKRSGLLLAFLVALVSTAGSLFYSQIAGFAPCELCWLQRIFMYPLVIVLGVALIKKDFHIIDYALTLSVIGFVISAYHNYVYYYNWGLHVACQVLGSSASCVQRYVFEFGYITIPVMALTTFSLTIIFLFLAKSRSNV
ncbi:MAG: disulfide bond formation protein B [Candidatus Staskawiczbacteria bacterium]|nr:disulfide bond formation protein B [Candidatus Staskawiczbacteria bacterium]